MVTAAEATNVWRLGDECHSHSHADAMNRRVLVVTSDHVGKRMAGPAIRAFNLARELAIRGHAVTLAAPNSIDVPIDGVVLHRLDFRDARATIALARSHDAVVAQWLAPAAMVSLARSETRVVYDLYDPVLYELLASVSEHAHQERDDLQLQRHRLILETALLGGNAFICASERQRDLWLGALAALGRLGQDEHFRDPAFRHLIDVVPFGVEANPPAVAGPSLRGVLPGVDERSRILIWGGGIWNWLDPLTVIRSVHELSRTRDDIRLVFMGLGRPGVDNSETMGEIAVALSRELGLYGTTVLFHSAWVPYEERGAWLAEADIGVSAHFDTLEARFAFRTRVLDYLWAGLPIATTSGDVFGELIERERLGAVIPPRDVQAWVAALSTMLDDDRRHAMRDRIEPVRERFEWSRVVEPLVRLLSEQGGRVDLPRRARLTSAHERLLTARLSLIRRGAVGTVAEGLKRRSSRPPWLR
jgi:glycosyltransferase involved in cell wall biosynthesis